MDPKFTIVIPTLAARRKELEQAIASVLGQVGGGAVPLVVVNGNRYDPELITRLKQDPAVRFHYLEEGNLPKAIAYGRSNVDTPFFGFLDDDDEYLPDALAIRYRPFETDPEIDVVVGNGWHDVAGKSEQVWTDPAPIAADPAGCLLESNWLASCGALFRTDTVGMEYFNAESRFLEWTYLAFHLALTRKLFFTTEPTYVINNSPGSLSDSDAYVEAHVAVLNRMLKFDMPPALRTKLKSKISAANHSLSEHYRRRGVKSAAWKYHFQSMAGINGLLQYGVYTRKLLALSQR